MSGSTAAAPPAADPILLREDAGGVATLTLNRPAHYNSLSAAMLARLTETFEALAHDESVRVVVIAGAGTAFCAGHDLKEMRAMAGEEAFVDLFDRCSRMMMAIVDCPKPVIARVHGVATAAGCQLVATCDLAIAGDAARFGTSGIDVGLFCSTPMVALSRNVGRKRAMEMLLTGELIDAAAAVDYGLVNRAVPAEDLDGAVAELAAKVAGKSAPTIALGKAAFYRQLEMDLASAYRHTARVMARNMCGRDAEEGIDAFIEKRRPEWRHR